MPSVSRAGRVAALYLAAQGFGGIAWWALLAVVPASRPLFFTDEHTILSYLIPDAILFIGGSLVGADAVRRGLRRAGSALWCTFGAVAYSTLHTIGLAAMADRAWLGAALMAAAMIGTGVVAACHVPREAR